MNKPTTIALFSKNKRILLWCVLITSFASAQEIPVNCDWTVYTFPSGKKASEGCLVNGKPEGTWTSYFTNGNIKSVGARMNFLLHGEWVFFDSTETKVRTVEYVANQKSGWERVYFSNGTVKEEIQFKEDKKSGWTNLYDESGQKRKSIPYRADLEDGKGREFALDGRVISLLDYQKGYLRGIEKINRYDEKNAKTGTWMEWSDSGILLEQGVWKGGKRNGLFRFYDQWGQLDRVEKYLDGEVISDAEETVEIDVRTTVHENGTVASRATYENEKRVGTYSEYDNEGTIIAGALYDAGVMIGKGITNSQGKRVGSWKQFYTSGELKSEGGYQNGQREGLWKFYAESGELVQEGKYKEGAYHGNWKWYYLNGSIHRDESYRNGKASGLFREWDFNGKLIVQGTYDFGLKQGPWVMDVNDHREEGNYLDDERDGDWVHVHPNGQKQFEGSYESGVPIGKHIYKDTQGSMVRVERYDLGERDGKWMFYGPNQTLIQTLDYKRGKLFRIDGQRLKDSTSRKTEPSGD